MIREIAAEEAVVGTNCGNCEFSKGAKDVKDAKLDEQGGTIPPDDKKKELAKKADLITMPGKAEPKAIKWCKHKEVDQPISDRMCCAFWNNPGAHRSYGKQAIGK